MGRRLEVVQLDLDGNFITQAAAASGAARALRLELDQLGRVRMAVNTQQQLGQVQQNSQAASRGVRELRRDADATDRSINQLTGRLSLLADGLLVLGPAAVPIGAVAAAGISGLALATTAATAAGLTAIVAFQGVGDALKAANEYAVAPTAENLAKLEETTRLLSPQTQRFIREYRAMIPLFRELRDSAADGVFPGITASLNDFEKLAPRAAELLNLIGTEIGDVVAGGAESLAGERWVGVLGYLRDELPDVVSSLARIGGDFAHGAATLVQRLDPANDGFIAWLEGMADGFDDWASSGQGRDDIRQFLDYLSENGDDVKELAGSLVDATAAIAGAAAPLGGPVLQGLTTFLNIIESIAETDAATPLLAAYAAFRLYARGAALATAAQAGLNRAQRTTVAQAPALSRANLNALNASGLTGTPLGAALAAPRASSVAAAARQQRIANISAGAQGAAVAGMVAMSATPLGELTEKAGASNTAMLTLLGTMVMPGWGTAAGALGGVLLDMAGANDTLAGSIEKANSALAAGDLTAAAQNLATARGELGDLKESVDVGKWEIPSFGDGLAKFKNDFESLPFIGNGKSDVEEADEGIRAAEDYYHALYQISKLKPVSNYQGFNDLFGDMTGAITPTTNALQDFVGAMEAANTFLSYRANLVSYEEAWDNIRASIKKNGTTLDETTEKGRNNIQALDGLANTGLKFAESLTGYKRTTFLKRLAGDIREAAGEFDMSKGEVDDYLERLGLLDRKEVKPKVGLDDKEIRVKLPRTKAYLDALDSAGASPFVDLYTSPFDAGMAGVQGGLDAIDGDTATPFVDLYKGAFDSGLSNARSDLARFDGSSATAYLNIARRIIGGPLGVAATGSADGSTVPETGRGYADRHLYLLADGEEVVSNRRGQARRHRRLLKGVNADLPTSQLRGMLAEGGTAGDYDDLIGRSQSRDNKTAARALKDLERALDANTKSLDKAREKRDAYLDYRQEVRGSLAAPLTGNGLAGFDAANEANGRDARSAVYALLQAKKKGLDGPLFDLVASSGDINLIRQFGQLSRAQIALRERRYASTTRAEGLLGTTAANEKFDATLNGLNRQIRELAKTNKKLEKAVERGAERGTRKGSAKAAASRNRNTHTRARAGR